MRLSYSVKTKIRLDKMKIDNTYPLYHQVIFNSEVLKISIPNASLRRNEWNESKQEANRKFPDYKNLNYVLRTERSKIEKFLYDCRINELQVTKRLLKEFYHGKDKAKKNFYQYFDQFYARKATEVRKGTLAHYKLLRKQLFEYRPDLFIDEIDYSFLDDFFHYLKTDKAIGASGIAMRRKNLVTAFGYFKKKGFVKTNPAKDFKKPKENIREEFLTPKELSRVRELNLDLGSRAEGYNLSRDIFLFACYTGFRFGDVMKLKTKHIKKNRIEKKMEKTNNLVKVPLVDESKELIMKYANRKDTLQNIFPHRSNVSVNRDLKDIARWAKIDKRVSHHTGRHTFGSILAMKGVQSFYIMKLMGHKDVRMTEKYVNTNDSILSEVIDSVSFD